MNMNVEPPRIKMARRRAGRRLGFLIHAAVFVAVNVALIGINLGIAPGRPWALFPLLGWGLGLLMHGLFALGFFGRMYQGLVARELARLPATNETQR
jgi:hypothetical protein